MNWQTFRDVALDPEAAASLDEACKALNRAEDAWRGLEWLLARRPKQGASRVVGGIQFNLYVQASDPLAATPQLTVLFTYDDDKVVIHRIKAETPIDESETEPT